MIKLDEMRTAYSDFPEWVRAPLSWGTSFIPEVARLGKGYSLQRSVLEKSKRSAAFVREYQRDRIRLLSSRAWNSPYWSQLLTTHGHSSGEVIRVHDLP